MEPEGTIQHSQELLNNSYPELINAVETWN